MKTAAASLLHCLQFSKEMKFLTVDPETVGAEINMAPTEVVEVRGALPAHLWLSAFTLLKNLRKRRTGEAVCIFRLVTTYI